MSAEAFSEAPLPARDPEEDGSALPQGDFYMEGPYIVFTEQYHLRRGYCCNSDCRHCPYKQGTA